MVLDINTVMPLNDFPETPYRKKESVPCVRVRWIHAQCYQIEMSDGKVLMTDPFFPYQPKATVGKNVPKMTPEDIGRVDYVIINHSHFDHVDGLPDVFRENNPLVICNGLYSRELSCALQIPEYNIFPIMTGLSYHFDSFDLDTVHGRHNDLGKICSLDGGPMAKPDNPAYGPLDSFGVQFNTEYLFTLKNHYRIGFAAGDDIDRMADAWKKNGPNLLLRQRIAHTTPEQYTKECEALGGQLVLPMHHDLSFEWNADMNAYTEKVNKLLREDNCPMTMFNPERLKWYTVHAEISID